MEAFLDGSDDAERLVGRVEAYRTLTLVRHVWISDRIPERRRFTPEILALCEDLLLAERSSAKP